MRRLPQVLLLSISYALAGRLGSGGGSGKQAGRVGASRGNQPPTIAGSPPRSIQQGEFYKFRPAARDADGDELVFRIDRKPDWATFNSATGRIAGTPEQGDAGTFSGIEISVSDGIVSAELDAFGIAVNQVAPGSATLSWNPPTEYENGSILGDLAGYRIYYGRSANQLNLSIVVNNPGLTRYVVDNLSADKWHFAMTSVSAGGTESKRSKVVSKRIA